MEEEKSVVAKAVRELRQVLGESQEAFARRMKVTVRTIARWETVRPPKDYVVIRTLINLAFAHGRRDILFALLDQRLDTSYFDIGVTDARRFLRWTLLGRERILENPWDVTHPPGLEEEWANVLTDARIMLDGPKAKDVRRAFDAFAAQIEGIKCDLFGYSISSENIQDPGKIDTPERTK